MLLSLCRLVMNAASMPAADIVRHQHLRGLLDMAYHNGHGRGSFSLTEGGERREQQSREQQYGFHFHNNSLVVPFMCDLDHFLS